jgi:5,10-methenyltetrahydromethanopterin hydrogenase
VLVISGILGMTPTSIKLMRSEVSKFNSRNKYVVSKLTFEILVATAIKENVAGAEVIFNLVPKAHAMSDIYCQLIPNEDE